MYCLKCCTEAGPYSCRVHKHTVPVGQPAQVSVPAVVQPAPAAQIAVPVVAQPAPVNVTVVVHPNPVVSVVGPVVTQPPPVEPVNVTVVVRRGAVTGTVTDVSQPVEVGVSDVSQPSPVTVPAVTQRCVECESGDQVQDADFRPGDRVMCGYIQEGRNGGLPSTTRFAATVKSVKVLPSTSSLDRSNSSSSRVRRRRRVSCHILFDDGVCQNVDSKYVKHV